MMQRTRRDIKFYLDNIRNALLERMASEEVDLAQVTAQELDDIAWQMLRFIYEHTKEKG